MVESFTYPLTPPSTPKQRRIILRPQSAVARSQSVFTGQQQVQVHDGQWWEMDVTMPPMDRDTAAAWDAFFTKLNGTEGTFNMGMDNAATGLGALTGTPLVKGGSQTGNALDIDGAPNSVTGWAKAGDYIQIGAGADAHLHKVVDDADSDGSGNVTLSIWPNLRTSPADNDAVIVSSTVGLFRLQESISIDISLANFHGFSFRAIEAI